MIPMILYVDLIHKPKEELIEVLLHWALLGLVGLNFAILQQNRKQKNPTQLIKQLWLPWVGYCPSRAQSSMTCKPLKIWKNNIKFYISTILTHWHVCIVKKIHHWCKSWCICGPFLTTKGTDYMQPRKGTTIFCSVVWVSYSGKLKGIATSSGNIAALRQQCKKHIYIKKILNATR